MYGHLSPVVAFHDIVHSEYSRRGGYAVHFLWEYLKTEYEHKEFIQYAEVTEENTEDAWGGLGVLFLTNRIGWHPQPFDYNPNRRE